MMQNSRKQTEREEELCWPCLFFLVLELSTLLSRVNMHVFFIAGNAATENAIKSGRSEQDLCCLNSSKFQTRKPLYVSNSKATVCLVLTGNRQRPTLSFWVRRSRCLRL